MKKLNFAYSNKNNKRYFTLNFKMSCSIRDFLDIISEYLVDPYYLNQLSVRPVGIYKLVYYPGSSLMVGVGSTFYYRSYRYYICEVRVLKDNFILHMCEKTGPESV